MKEIIVIFQMLATLLQSVSALGFSQEDVLIHNYNQKMYIVEVDMSKNIELKSFLARNSVFGFENLGDIITKNQGIIGVNGMFFDGLGSPAGMLCENGEWIRINDIQTPSLIVTERINPKYLADDVSADNYGQVMIDRIKVHAFWQSEADTGEINVFNIGAFPNKTNVFTKAYGSTNRVFRPNVSYRVMGNIVTHRYLTDEPIQIQEGYLITYLLPDNTDVTQINWANLPANIPYFQVGDTLEIKFETKNQRGDIIHPIKVCQGGGWLIHDNKIVAKPYEAFIGFTTSLQPRTAVGINKKGNLMFFVVDGRQKNIAEGLTGKWLAEVMQEYGMVEAMYLDGGASTMLWLKDGLVNQPAYPDKVNGKEISHAFLMKRKQWK